ncbi:MAG: glycogen synthase [Caldilineae bacterium]|nr:MAG: glycogen synthase [Caldilineae bacterium]
MIPRPNHATIMPGGLWVAGFLLLPSRSEILMDNTPFNILYLTTELSPYARTGGLAQVAAALPRALAALGDDVRIILPRYGLIDPEQHRLRRVLESFPVPFDHETETAGLWQAQDSPLPVYFVEHHRFFGSRKGIYSFPDDGERFIFFSRAALEAVRRLDWQPHAIHCNEWQTALVPNWMRTLYASDPFFAQTAVLYNIHNLSYQGIFGQRVLEIAGIAEHGFIAHPEVSPSLNQVVDMMARGIIFADIIVTVSPTYAREILTPEYGEGLDPILRDRQDRLFGILNGIDTESFDPARDPHLAATYDRHNLQGRDRCRLALLQEAGLPDLGDAPIICMTSRLSDQKGYDILETVLEPMLRHLETQWVIMGTGEDRYHNFLENLQARFPQKLRVLFTYSETLARRLFAGADIFLMPSRHEPCGLDQLLAMRYGAIPVVHATGGLADTVQDHRPPVTGTGFSFQDYDGMALFAAMVRACEVYRHPTVWADIRQEAMGRDHSWASSAREYRKLYRRARSLKLTGRPQ